MKATELEFNSVFSEHIKNYLELQTSLGYKYTIEGYMIRQFDRFCSRSGISDAVLSGELVEKWLATKPDDSAATRGGRLCVLKGFRDYLENQGVAVYWSPSPGYSKGREKAVYVPYIFTRSEMLRFFSGADKMPQKRGSSFSEMFPIVIRILYGCGLRVSEALSLRICDVNFADKCITVLDSKFEKSRKIPISDSLETVLKNYIAKGLCGIDEEGFLFPSKDGSHYSKRTVYDNFRQILKDSGIPYRGKGKGPRVHDLRHTFAVHSLQKQIDEGRDVYSILPVLSSYLGHVDVSSTEYYLRLTAEFFPELLAKSEAITTHVFPEVVVYEA